MSFKLRQQITVLKNKGFKENVDFRVVYFSDNAEIKMIRA